VRETPGWDSCGMCGLLKRVVRAGVRSTIEIRTARRLEIPGEKYPFHRTLAQANAVLPPGSGIGSLSRMVASDFDVLTDNIRFGSGPTGHI